MKKRYRFMLTTVAVVVVVAVVGNVLLFNALPKPLRAVETVDVDYAIASDQFLRSAGALFKQPVVAGNQVEWLKDGEAIYAAMIEAVNNAEHSITFETYEFWGEESAGALASALADAAQRGVEVRGLADFLGSRQADPSKFERMNDAGVAFIRWREPSWYGLARFNHRTHRKILVVDGREGFIGGANIANAWLPGPDESHYRDNHFRVRGPVVASLQAAFLDSWMDASGELISGERWFPALEPEGDMAAQVVNSAPREGRHRMRTMFLHAIAAAEQQITASTAYFYPDQGFLDALAAAADRGVRVRILVPGDSIDQGYLRQASVNRWGPMLEAGVELFEYQPRMYHSKLMTIDDRWASVGSANLDNRSFRLNDEANLTVHDADFARKIRAIIEADMEDSEGYTRERWGERAWHKRAYGWLGMAIGIYL